MGLASIRSGGSGPPEVGPEQGVSDLLDHRSPGQGGASGGALHITRYSSIDGEPLDRVPRRRVEASLAGSRR